jgi:hypothetical protein
MGDGIMTDEADQLRGVGGMNPYYVQTSSEGNFLIK